MALILESSLINRSVDLSRVYGSTEERAMLYLGWLLPLAYVSSHSTRRS